MTSKILLVEDDRNFGDVLRSYLEMHDFEVTLATDGEAGLIEFNKGNFELCIFAAWRTWMWLYQRKISVVFCL